jgi:hypothetical protein
VTEKRSSRAAAKFGKKNRVVLADSRAWQRTMMAAQAEFDAWEEARMANPRRKYRSPHEATKGQVTRKPKIASKRRSKRWLPKGSGKNLQRLGLHS